VTTEYREVFNNSVFGDIGLSKRVSNLEDTYVRLEIFEEVSSTSGTLSVPTGASIVLDQFTEDVDAICTVIPTSGERPLEEIETDSVGNLITVSLSGTGNADYTLSGTPQGAQYAIQYVVDTQLINLPNVNRDSILNTDEVQEPFEFLKFDITSGHDTAEGELAWNDTEGTLNIGLKGGTVNLQTGQEVVDRARNTEGSQIDNGQVVFISGASGAISEIQKPIATNPAEAPRTYAVATEDIANNQLGYVTLVGKVRDVNTTGSLYSETWADGEILYLSATVDGGLTKVRPTPPNTGVVIGVVLRAHATEGVLGVNPTVIQAHSLSSDVLISSIADNDITYWDTNVWKNAGINEIGTSLTQGSDLFAGANGVISEDNANKFWDDTNKRQGFGTNTPEEEIHAFKTGDVTSLLLENSTGFNTHILRNYSNTEFHGGFFIAQRAKGTKASPLKNTLNNTIFTFDAAGYDGSDFVRGGQIIGKVQNTPADSAGFVDFYWAFRTTTVAGVLRDSLQILADGDARLPFDDQKLLFGSGNGVLTSSTADVSFSYNGTDFILDTGLLNPSDFIVDCGTEKTIELVETVWDDLKIPVTAIRLGGASAPTETAYKGGSVLAFGTAVSDKITFDVQLPHEWKEGTDIKLHIHWTIPTSGAGGGAENVKWDATYSWANINSTFPAESSASVTVDVQNDVLDDHMVDTVVTISGSGKTLSSMLICSLSRDVAVADDYGDDAYLIEVDFHYEIDTMGSRQEFIK
jgi:hypothetical protein